MNTLQHRTNNAYDTILLVDADTNTVVGEWSASDEALIDYHNLVSESAQAAMHRVDMDWARS